MSCSRCGQSRPRPITTPTIVGRPGGITVPAQRPVAPMGSTAVPANTIRNAINGLRYIPNVNGNK